MRCTAASNNHRASLRDRDDVQFVSQTRAGLEQTHNSEESVRGWKHSSCDKEKCVLTVTDNPKGLLGFSLPRAHSKL